MVKIEIKGGLGNQMFQYAHARKLILVDKKEVVLDLSFFKKIIGASVTQRDYKLENFNIVNIKIVESKKPSFFNKILNKILRKLRIYKEEYFQSEIYFNGIKHILREEFTLKNPFAKEAKFYEASILAEREPVSIHIRRGDYINDKKINSIHGSCNLQYYRQAIQHIEKEVLDPTFFIFSDDIEWVKNNFKVDNSVYVSNTKIQDFEELILMSKCKHNIIANSTFSWWGAWLNSNPKKVIIAPKQWTAQKTSDDLKILPKEWVQL